MCYGMYSCCVATTELTGWYLSRGQVAYLRTPLPCGQPHAAVARRARPHHKLSSISTFILFCEQVKASAAASRTSCPNPCQINRTQRPKALQCHCPYSYTLNSKNWTTGPVARSSPRCRAPALNRPLSQGASLSSPASACCCHTLAATLSLVPRFIGRLSLFLKSTTFPTLL